MTKPKLPLDAMPYHSQSNTPRKLTTDLKMLIEIGPGQVVFVLGRWLQPFCSHATYRVKVTETQRAGSAFRRIHGFLIDFQDSPVMSVCLPDQQMFRVDSSAPAEAVEEKPRLSKEDIERIVRGLGISAGFREARGALWVDTWKYLRVVRINGKKLSEAKKFRLGKLDTVAMMTEEDLASLVRAKFGLDLDLDLKEESRELTKAH